MTAITTRRRRRCRRHNRVAFFHAFKGELAGITLLSRDHTWHTVLWAGYYLGKIVNAKVNRKSGQVVQLKVQLCGGDPAKGGGFNGPIFLLKDRREFVGGNSRGILRGKSFVPVDQFYREMSRRRPASSMKRPHGCDRPDKGGVH